MIIRLLLLLISVRVSELEAIEYIKKNMEPNQIRTKPQGLSHSFESP